MSESDVATTYESLRDAVVGLSPALTESDRTLVWAEATHCVGVARDPYGRLEVFLAGDPLDAADPLVAENLDHQVWTTSSGACLPANRLVLPDAAHFDGVAAFICTELIENGARSDLVLAFRRSEPVIALALRRAALSNQALLGLAGELFVLARLTESSPIIADSLVASWYGFAPSSRDLQLGSVGVEIKTTNASTSLHHINGLHQIELGASVDDVQEAHLYLLSIGIEWLPATSAGSGRSIPELVDAIVDSLSDVALREAFIERVRQYGGDAAIGYDHRSHRLATRYARRFHTRFERLYDLSDERIRIIRSADIDHAAHVELNSVNFRVRLPARVRGDLNPIAGMSNAARHLLERYEA